MTRAAAGVAVVLVVLAGCGGAPREGPAVFAASSLTDVFSSLDDTAAFSFGGSDTLAFQIEQGAGADVFASASPKETDALFARGLVRRPRVFARNRLVLAVPRDNPAGVRSWRDVARPGVRTVLASRGVPAGDYAREAFRRLGIEPASVVSEEPDVRGVLTKIALGGADVGVVYRTDVRAGSDDVRALPVPDRAQPPIEYTIAVVAAGDRPAEASAFVMLVLGAEGRAALRREGFETP